MASGEAWKLQFDSFMADCPGTTNKNWGFYVYLTYDETDENDDSAGSQAARLLGSAFQTFVEATVCASSDQVRSHFKAHFYNAEEYVGPREDVVLVVDNEVLESIRAGPPPIIYLPEHTGTASRYYSRTRSSNGEKDVFVKALELGYKGGKEGIVRLSVCRGRAGGVAWKGVLKVFPSKLHQLWTKIQIDVFPMLYDGDDSKIFGV